jgi:hypothetical protein
VAENDEAAEEQKAEEQKKERQQRRRERKAAQAEASPPKEGEEKTRKQKRKKKKLKLKQRRKKRQAAEAEKAEAIEAPAEVPDLDAFPMQRTSQTPTVISFPTLDAIALKFSKGRFVVDIENVPFHAYFERANDKRLFVLLSGAAPGGKKSGPHFERRGLGWLLPGSILCISDPTLELSEAISLGWYVGTSEKDYTRQMAKLVDRVATELGLSHSDIFFYASSGGGFAALMCARFLPGANCIVVNPQIDLARHHREHRKQLAEVFAENGRFSLIAEEHSQRISVLAAFPDADKLPPTVYVQNRNDEHHFKNHFEVFCETYGAPKEGGVSANGRILTLLFEHDAGHGPEPRPLVRPLLAQALAFFDRFRPRQK